MSTLTFSWTDYLCFCLIGAVSLLVGIYYGCFGNKQSTTKDYMFGGKNMRVFPVAMSLAASSFSAIALLATPSEIYMHGTQFWMTIPACVLMGLINNFVYLPVFYPLQLNSMFDYLSIRFNGIVSKLIFLCFAGSTFCMLPITFYLTALALNQVTGFNIRVITSVTAAVCTFYTAIGGLKAIVWTDTLQFTVTLTSLGYILVKGIISVGGLSAIWERAENGSRIEFFNLDPDPTLRASFWSVLLGQTCIWITISGIHPSAMQRYIAIPSLRHARITLALSVLGSVIINSVVCFFGLLMYAEYFDCDPLTTGRIQKADQILPYFVMEIGAQMSGVSGLFVAGTFTASLSTLSTFLNTLSGAIYTDLIKLCIHRNISEKIESYIIKLTTIATGFACLIMAFVIDNTGSIIEMQLSFNGITTGPLIGIFTLGMLFPFVNSKGALYGGVGSLLLLSWIVVKAKLHSIAGNIKYEPKPLLRHGCNETDIFYNKTVASGLPSHESSPEDLFWLFTITFHYYIVIGTLATIIIGVLHGLLTKTPTEKLRKDLFSPLVHRFLPASVQSTQYQSVKEEQEPESQICND